MIIAAIVAPMTARSGLLRAAAQRATERIACRRRTSGATDSGVARLVLACLPLFVLIPGAASHAATDPPLEYAMTVWASEKGMPPGDIFAIAQDLDGVLWLGTPTGLLQFDGTRFSPWSPPDPAVSLPAAPVHAIVGARDGSVWVGFGGGAGIMRIERGRVTRYAATEGAPPAATAMIEDRHGAIWVAVRRGLYRFQGGRWTSVGAADGYTGGEASSVFEDRQGRLWVGSAVGVFRRSADTFELVDHVSTGVQGMAADPSGALWVTDPSQIVQRLATHNTPRRSASILVPTGGWRVLEDSHGQLWVAAFTTGLLRIRTPLAPAPTLERVAYESRLAGSPRALFEDRDGNLWVGMRGGLLRLSRRSFTAARPLEGVANDGVRTAAVGGDGSVWVATAHGLNRFAGSSHSAFGLSQTMALHTDRHGVLWVSTSREIGRLQGRRVVPVGLPDEVRSSRVMAITTDGTDTLWLCTALKGVLAWDGGRLSRFDDLPEVSNRACQSIHTDRAGRVWAGLTSGGVALFQAGQVRFFGQRDGLTPGTVLGILDDRDGAVWFSTSGGVTRYEDGRLTPITAANGPLTDIVPVLVEDDAGYLWVGVNSGASVLRFHPNEADKVQVNPAHQVEYRLFDESDGMTLGSQTWQSGVGGVRGGDGRLWVATGLGMVVIDPQHLPESRPPTPPRLDAVIVDGRRRAPATDLTLPAGTSTLRFEYGAVSLSSASKLRFRYMLDGLDDEWVYAGTARDATYASVPSGTYRFRVAATLDGRWTEAAPWMFGVAPPFYLTQLFFVLVASGMAFAVGSAWWLRLRAVRNQYGLVLAERARLSREIHDTLLQSLAAIGVELESIATELDPAQGTARDGLRRLRRQVGHCLREARESILELRRNTLKPRALVDALRDLAAHTTETRGVSTVFTTTGRARPCGAEADVQLLRIAQEAVGNALRHGGPRAIHVALAFADGRVVLTVADDGCGFVPEDREPAPASGQHLGLLAMHERAARVGGRLTIGSHPGQGTAIEADVPLPAS